MQTVILSGPKQRQYAASVIANAAEGAKVTISDKAETRTARQNRLIHRWFEEVAAHLVEHPADVKAQCNLMYGVPILARDDAEWLDVFGDIFAALRHEAKLKAIRVLDIPFTRRMSVKQLCEYMDQMQREYLRMGVILTDPEKLKYEAPA